MGFEFNGVHASTYNVYLKSRNRVLIPTQHRREIIIPGKHGIYDFGLNTLDKRILELNLSYLSDSTNDLRLDARDIAAWLCQTEYEELIFDDEPDKYYLAKIYDTAGLEDLITIGLASIKFECQPHALYVVTSAEDVYLDDGIPLDSDILLDSGDDYTIHL